MKTTLINLFLAIVAFAFGARDANAISLSLVPTPQVINVGDPASMDIVVSDLGNLAPPSLGAFDLDLSYNAAVVSAASVTFGSFLDLGVAGSVQFSDLSVAGAIHLDEISFESAADLNNTQPGSFVLATLGFSGIAPGLSPIIFTFASLSDELGQSLSFTLNTGLIDVVGPPIVPDTGSTSTLFLAALGSFCALRRYRRN